MEPIIGHLNLIQLAVIFILLVILIRLFKQMRVYKLNKRIDKYTVKSVSNPNDLALGDYIYHTYRGLI
jgi:hypothetical protein